MLRTHTCGELRKTHIGKKVTLAGWADTIRSYGKLHFIDLRDRYGKTQIVIKGKCEIKPEYVIQIIGEVKARKPGSENKELQTGQIEVLADKIEILSEADTLPFEIDKEDVNEDLRLKYRYLDLRRPKMISNLTKRHEATKFIRDFLDKEKFIEITTPILTKSTPEGARDFIVPSRIHPGKFYALPQSPQQYKQLLMVAGYDKYFQIAPCFRDEDARADRSPGEFYQLDLEMGFVKKDDVLDVIERMYIEMIKEIFPDKKIAKTPFPKLTYDEAVKKYGTDKPDIRENKKDPNELAFCWVVDFPLFEEKKEKGNYAPKHHMFTMPKKEHWKYLNKKDAHKAKSDQYDLVLNGFEIGGGSIRIHIPEIQSKIFELIGFDKKQKEYFSHMLTAFKYGVPPHGGIAPGIDRSLMVIMGEPNIRELIAFPKNKAAQDVTMDAPSEISLQQLKEANISLNLPKKKK